jgi:hypothetical protein
MEGLLAYRGLPPSVNGGEVNILAHDHADSPLIQEPE